MTSKFRRLACVCLTAVMGTSLVAGNALALAQSGKNPGADVSDRYDTVNFENVTGKVNLSGVALDNMAYAENTDYTKVVSGKKSVIVTLNEKAVMDSMGEGDTVKSYVNSFSGTMALKRISDNQNAFFEQLNNRGVKYTLLSSYNTVMNGVALEIDTSDIAVIKAFPQVESVVFSETYAFPKAADSEGANGAQTNPSNVYATGIYNSSAYLEKYSDGSGMKVAVLDTGLDYTHDAFNHMPEHPDYTIDTISGLMDKNTFTAVKASAQKGVNITAEDVYINAKVPYAYDYADKDADVYPSYSQHGTHVAGIIAGQSDSYTDKDGNIPEDENGKIPFSGVAPQAQLVICKIFTDNFDDPELGGARSEDIIAALEDCVNLGVDVVNMSIGTTSGFGSVSIDGDTEGQKLNEIYARLKQEGISVLAAAGNEFSSGYGSAFGTNRASNPDSGTVGSPSTFTGSLSVASINGQLSRYMSIKSANNGAETDTPVFYLDSSDENSVQNDFCRQMLSKEVLGSKWRDGITSYKFKYVVIPGVGNAADYSKNIQNILADKNEGPVIAVVRRGSNTFKDKVQIAQRMKADAIIVANNVAGTIRMSLGDLKNPIPAVSVSMDAGAALSKVGQGKVGYIEVNSEYQAGPFMNDYSSWGATPDLRLKPEVTSHGGEITSTVAGGYAEMSGTSMATPNLAGFVALLRSYLAEQDPSLSSVQLTTLVNQLVMSTATTVYDQSHLAYSPRKQGAGLATLENVFTTKAYLYTETAEDNRPKIELGDDKQKKGVYELEFYVRNTGNSPLTFSTKSLFMTETLSSDGLSVAEQAHMLNGSPAWTVDGEKVAEGGDITVPAGKNKKIHVTLTLSAAEKSYIDKSFENGMYVEGFLKLVSKTEGQCDLTLPFMGFYGDWDAAPLLDYNAFQITEFKKDASYTDETRPQPQVWATQAYGAYYNNKYYVPLGSFMYTQDENADQIYTEEEHTAISMYSDYYGEESTRNYMTITSIRALYAGLLRNAELVTYELYNAETGEALEIYDSETGLTKQRVYRSGKAHANGGSVVPSLVDLEISPSELGLTANGKYQLVFHFYRKAEDLNDPAKQDNTFEMSFYVDYEAPVLVDSRIRYEDYKENNKDKQRVYLDLDIFDNHYAQAVILCYAENEGTNSEGAISLNLANDYITPIYNSVKNGINTVSLDITDIYEKYNSRLYVQIDDYALNHNVYQIGFTNSKASGLPSSFEFADDGKIVTKADGSKEITIGVNEAYKLKLDYEGSANLSNFTWSSNRNSIVRIKNNEIFGASAGDATVTVTGEGNARKTITVHVVDNGAKLSIPSLSFGVIKTSDDGIKKAQGSVKVSAGQTFKLDIETDPWYYPIDTLELRWSSTDPSVATVDQNGNVTTLDEEGSATIQAAIVRDGTVTAYAATVMLSVQDPFTISNMTLTKYHGSGGAIVIPADKNIMTIGEEAFKDNDNITSIVIPKTVTQISARAFKNCTALEKVYFICEGTPDNAKLADLSVILRNAFEGCTKLELVDFTNVKTISLDRDVFLGCTSLETVLSMDKIGTMGDNAFANCTSLKSADITGLHTAGSYVFGNCNSLEEVKTAFYTQIGSRMFSGCSSLGSIEINNAYVADNAFERCATLKTVSFGAGLNEGTDISFRIGSRAFWNCAMLDGVKLNGYKLTSIGDRAFENCSALKTLEVPNSDVSLGESVFVGTNAVLELPADCETVNGAIYRGTTLILAPKTVTADFKFKAGTTEIGAYAFSDSELAGGVEELIIPASVTKIGEGAFAHFGAKRIVLHSGITRIEDYTFYDCAINDITIPASVTYIGESAFQGAMTLTGVTFEANSSLKVIGGNAFLDCYSLIEIALPDGASTMGDSVFGNCRNLVKAVLPSVTSLGVNTFFGCTNLEEVSFGANATDAGEYTFFPGYITDANGNLYVDENGRFIVNTSSLKKVTLSSGMRSLGASVFDSCSKLEAIDLKNITVIGAQAFAGCTSLETVTGLDKVVKIGDAAFADCVKIHSLILTSATDIGNLAFYCSEGGSYSVVQIPAAVNIGANAFSGSIISTIQLPASVKFVGDGAFANSSRLTSINVEKGNESYFSEDGVLYRSFTNGLTGKTAYELVAYPSLKSAELYEIKEGTVSVANYAFAYLYGSVKHVLLPYSVKTVGHAAFYESNIGEYTFHSITAPTLIIEYYDIPMQSTDGMSVNYYALFYMNFNDEVIRFSNVTDSPDKSEIKINYPENGTGYDNYIYGMYFGTRVTLDEMPDDDTRLFIETVNSFPAVDVINGWSSLDVNDSNTDMVKQFSEEVKNAHVLYNNISRSEKQLSFLNGEENTLFAVEAALKPVKTKFGITTYVTSVYVSPDSTHKTEYKAGEKFDITGLKLIVEYDDYSTEVADMSQIKLADGYDRELTELDVEVRFTGYGKTIRVGVKVTEGPVDSGGDKKEKGGCKSAVTSAAAAGAALIAVLAGVVALRAAKGAKRENIGEDL